MLALVLVNINLHTKYQVPTFTISKEMSSPQNKTSISANADGPSDAASHKIDQITLHTECNHQAMNVGR